MGRVLRFDDVRGYGFISPADGGDDVFVHANDFGLERHLVRPGITVEYEAEEGDRGLKVSTVRIVDGEPAAARVPVASGDDDGMCDVLAPGEFTAEITEVLLQHVPTLTAAQILQVRARMLAFATAHGWIEA